MSLRVTDSDVRLAAAKVSYYVKREGSRGYWWGSPTRGGQFRSLGRTNAKALTTLRAVEEFRRNETQIRLHSLEMYFMKIYPNFRKGSIFQR
jgi:hypothetical protein